MTQSHITTKFFILGQVNYEGLTNLINDSSDDVTRAIIKLKKNSKFSTTLLHRKLYSNLTN